MNLEFESFGASLWKKSQALYTVNSIRSVNTLVQTFSVSGGCTAVGLSASGVMAALLDDADQENQDVKGDTAPPKRFSPEVCVHTYVRSYLIGIMCPSLRTA